MRPLSGRIFLRKTQEKGWIAKNVPEVSYEGLEIEDYDDIGDDTESVDSFFDDDFDTEEQDEKLQRLLTCTTLGVASKVRATNRILQHNWLLSQLTKLHMTAISVHLAIAIVFASKLAVFYSSCMVMHLTCVKIT